MRIKALRKHVDEIDSQDMETSKEKKTLVAKGRLSSSRRLLEVIVYERLERSQAKKYFLESGRLFLQSTIKMKFFSILCVFCFLPRPGLFFSITVSARTTSNVDKNVSTKKYTYGNRPKI